MSDILIAREGAQWGPYPLNDVNAMLSSGQLSPADLAWTEGMGEWVPLSAFPGVVLPSAAGSPPPRMPALPVPGAGYVMRPVAGAQTRPPAVTSGAVVASLITGLLGLLVCWMPLLGFPLGLVAVICGHVGRSNIRRSRGTLTGRGMGLAGLLMGYFCCLVPLIVVGTIFGLGFGVFKQAVKEAAERKTATHETIIAQRAAFTTRLIRNEKENEAAGVPANPAFKAVKYPAAPGDMAAYVSITASETGGKKRPALIWLVGGFGNSIGPDLVEPGPPENDQSASAFHDPELVLMYPSLRGGNQNPGQKEGLFGEVDDVLAAVKWLKLQPGVDPSRIYLGGHSTGGTLALLVAEASPDLRAVFAFGPAADVSDYGQDNLPFDVTNRTESSMRSPVSWLAAISCPVFVIEGTGGNIDSLNELQRRNQNERIVFLPLSGEDHFSGLQKTSKILAGLILADNGPTANLPVGLKLIQAAAQKLKSSKGSPQ
jgi:alpha/beta superfamily hydrolase